MERRGNAVGSVVLDGHGNDLARVAGITGDRMTQSGPQAFRYVMRSFTDAGHGIDQSIYFPAAI